MTEWVQDGRGELTYRDREPGNGSPDGGPGLQIDVGTREGKTWWLLAHIGASGVGVDIEGGVEPGIETAKRAGLAALRRAKAKL